MIINNPPTPMKYWYTKQINTSFEEAIDDITMTLWEQGFGILTRIDLQEAMKKKLDKNISKYMILGACNPHLAYEILQSEQEIGLLLPCNVIIYEKDEKIFVSVIIPKVMMWFIENEKLKEFSEIAEEKLKKAIDNI